ncbi:hypothetical protein V8G54_026355 [Vigna mungo]|uniref:Uncharacterized protein n=1 Tax=Vigna mungo TaxID=3915 RepID=A0AAQ3RQF4_VIGMU
MSMFTDEVVLSGVPLPPPTTLSSSNPSSPSDQNFFHDEKESSRKERKLQKEEEEHHHQLKNEADEIATHQEALKREIERLRQVYEQQRLKKMENAGESLSLPNSICDVQREKEVQLLNV